MTTPALGAQRVCPDFNPGSDTAVDSIKRAGAALIERVCPDFNPGSDTAVDSIKRAGAALIDEAVEPRCKKPSP